MTEFTCVKPFLCAFNHVSLLLLLLRHLAGIAYEGQWDPLADEEGYYSFDVGEK